MTTTHEETDAEQREEFMDRPDENAAAVPNDDTGAGDGGAADESTAKAASRQVTIKIPTLAGIGQRIPRVTLRRAAAGSTDETEPTDLDSTDLDDETSTDQGEKSANRARPGQTTRRIVVAVVLLALAAGCAYFYIGARNAQARVDARQAALSAAQTRVPQLLSYNYQSLDNDLGVANDQTTGDFHDDYAKILAQVVRPNATQKKVITKATVTGAAVVSGDQDHVVVLVFVTQSTTDGGSDPAVSGSRVDVTMTKTGDDWKISNLAPV